MDCNLNSGDEKSESRAVLCAAPARTAGPIAIETLQPLRSFLAVRFRRTQLVCRVPHEPAPGAQPGRA